MDTEPRINTPALWTRRHPLRYTKIREPADTRMIRTEHRTIPRLHLTDVALVRDGERTALEVVQALRWGEPG